MLLVTIVTIVKNNRLGFQKTYDSLVKQSHTNWEMLAVVGNSSDGSEELVLTLMKADNRINFSLDNSGGIYAAMNQGLEMKSSKLVWFMNSGDSFRDENTLERTIQKLEELNADLIIGGYATEEKNGFVEYSKKSGFISERRFSLNVRAGCHQSMLFKISEKTENLRFDTSYKLSSDFKYVLNFLKSSRCFRTSEILSIIEPGGASSREIRTVIIEKQQIRRINFKSNKTDVLLGEIWTVLASTKILLRMQIMRMVKNSVRMPT